MAEEWLRNIDGLKSRHELPDNVALDNALSHLVGAGRDWYDKEKDEMKSWDDFEGGFRYAFPHVEDGATSKWERMKKRVQLKSEEAIIYYHSKRKLC